MNIKQALPCTVCAKRKKAIHFKRWHLVGCTLALGRGEEYKQLTLMILFYIGTSLQSERAAGNKQNYLLCLYWHSLFHPLCGLGHCKHKGCCHNVVLKVPDSRHIKCPILLHWQG